MTLPIRNVKNTKWDMKHQNEAYGRKFYIHRGYTLNASGEMVTCWRIAHMTVANKDHETLATVTAQALEGDSLAQRALRYVKQKNIESGAWQ